MARPGDRVRLIRTNDPWTDLLPGMEGTVDSVDDYGTIHVRWDNGSRLGLIPGTDVWETVAGTGCFELRPATFHEQALRALRRRNDT